MECNDANLLMLICLKRNRSGGNLVTGCAHQAISGTKVVLTALGCDQTFHYHDTIMVGPRVTLSHVLGATRCATPRRGQVVKWFVRVDARKVPTPKWIG